MRLAFFSPLNPQRSGIGDYSEALLPHLADAGAEIDLFVDGFAPSNREITERFRVFDYKRAPQTLARLASYDAAVYHVGNDHRYHTGIYRAARAHPGVLILHDFALQDFFIGLARTENDWRDYLDELEAGAGRRARLSAEEAIRRGAPPPHAANAVAYPLNSRLVREAEAVIVHSEWSRARVSRIAPTTPVRRIPHLITLREDDVEAIRRAQPKDKIQIASFGLITPDKGIERALRALARLRHRFDFHYTLVGETNPYFDVHALIRELGMDERVTITEHVPLDDFVRRIAETDIAINLRERTVGETSGSLCRIMAAGVAAVVSNIGWFAEIPDSCVVKIDADRSTDALIEAYLARLIEDDSLRRRIGANARRFVFGAHRIEDCAAAYFDFIRETIERRTTRRFVGGVSAEAARLGIGEGACADEKVLSDLAREVAALTANINRAPVNEHANATARANGVNADARGDSMTKELASSEDELFPSIIAVEENAIEESLSEDDFASADDDKTAVGDASSLICNEAATAAESSRGSAESVEASEVALDSMETPDDESNSPAQFTPNESHRHGRLPKLEGLDYDAGALQYVQMLDDERRHYLYTKPFYNLANKPPKHAGEGMDAETHRHFCDFANMAVALALPAGSRILDVGCGSGWLSEYFARLGYDVTGIDISPDLIEMSRERLERVAYKVDHETPLRYRFVAQSIENAPLEEEFDAVICYDALHHFVDEEKVMRHLARMTRRNGLLFILEGDKPPDESETADELRGVMEKFATLESPFHPAYLRELLDRHGFAVIGDFVSVNGFFDRSEIEAGDRVRFTREPINYILCKKIAEAGAPASSVPDSRAPGVLAAKIKIENEKEAIENERRDGAAENENPNGDAVVNERQKNLNAAARRVKAGETFEIPLIIENTGDTLWRVGREARRGVVMLGVKIFDAAGATVSETHGEPPLPRPLAPGETTHLKIKPRALQKAGSYALEVDLVDQQICWFAERGSPPLRIPLEVE